MLVADVLNAPDKPHGLLHDGSETYLVDLPRPVKNHSELGRNYKIIETPISSLIYERFGLSATVPSSVKIADNRILMTEKRDLMAKSSLLWETQDLPYDFTIEPLSSIKAEQAFLDYAEDLGLL
jgi:hypothetical protein